MEKIEYKITKYNWNDINNFYKKKEIKIPNYQRNYVWKNEQIENLLNTILNEYPLGMIMFFEKDNFKFILDGQQRITSIFEIMKKPFKYINKDSWKYFFDDESFIEVNKNSIENLFEEIKDLSLNDDFQENEKIIFDALSKNATQWHSKISQIMEKFKDYLKNLKSGEKIRFSAIEVFNGEINEAIEIFQRLNNGGTKLSEIETLAAKWSLEIIKLRNNSLEETIKILQNSKKMEEIRETNEATPLDLIKAMIWNSLIDNEGKKSFFKEVFIEKGKNDINNIHLEKIIWLVRVLIIIFKEDKKGEEENKFSLINKISNDLNSNLEIGKYLKEINDNDPNKFDVFVDHLSLVWKEMEKNIPILNKKHNGKLLFVGTSMNLLISIASQMLYKRMRNEEYNVDYLQYNFIMEILKDSYKSSTDKRVEDSIRNLEYLNEIDEKDIEKKLDEINDNLKQSFNKNTGFKKVVKIVICLAYASWISGKIEEYDYKHIVLEKDIEKSNIEKGINCFGNCGLMIQQKNNKNSINNFDRLFEISKDEINFENEDEMKSCFEKIIEAKDNDAFKKFLDYRFKYLKKWFLKEIKPKHF